MIGHLADIDFHPYSTYPFIIGILMVVSGIISSVFIPEKFAAYEFYYWYGIAAYYLANCLV